MPEHVVFASGNPGKVREIGQMLADLELVVVPQSELGIASPPETAPTFVENALIKARYASRASGRAAIADDSGLEVDALGGAPGVHSARYAGAHADDAANVAKLLAALAAVPDAQRGARFRCVMVYLRHAEDPAPVIAQGTWEGRIGHEPRGRNGFGYDPVFVVPERGCTAAELAPAIKNRLSHRGQALRALVAALAAERARQAG